MALEQSGKRQTDSSVDARTAVHETSAPAQAVENTDGSLATVTPLSPDLTSSEQRGANLKPGASTRHGIGPLTQRGELPAGSDFDLFRDELEVRRVEARAWVGGDEANTFDRDDAEAYARWSTASDLIWGVLFAEGLLTQTRRRKSLVDLAERIDKRASYHRERCRGLRAVKDIKAMSAEQYLDHERQQQQRTEDTHGSTP